MLEGGSKTGVDSDSRNNGWLSLPLADEVSVSQSGVTVVVAVEAGGTLGAAVLERGSKTRVDSNSGDNDGSVGLGNSEGSKGNDSSLQETQKIKVCRLECFNKVKKYCHQKFC